MINLIPQFNPYKIHHLLYTETKQITIASDIKFTTALNRSGSRNRKKRRTSPGYISVWFE